MSASFDNPDAGDWEYGLIYRWRFRDSRAVFLVNDDGEYAIKWKDRDTDLHTVATGDIPGHITFNDGDDENDLAVRLVDDTSASLNYHLAFDVNGTKLLHLMPNPSEEVGGRSRDPKIAQGIWADPDTSFQDWQLCKDNRILVDRVW